MEYCEGGELYERLTEQPKRVFEESRASDIIQKLLHAINHCHSHGIIHRDLKLENVLFKSKTAGEVDEIKIIDFGLSTVKTNQKVQMNTPCGTPYYVAPEVINGENYGQECDIWSIGVITFVLLSGEFPFKGRTLLDIYDNIQQNEVDFSSAKWKNVSEEAKDFIKKCLNRSKDERISAIDGLKHQWISGELNSPQMSDEVIESLRNYQANSVLKKEALNVLVKIINEDLIQDLRSTFRSMDTDFTGEISCTELKEAIKESGQKITSSEIKKIVQNCDYQENGKINYSEFLAATLSPKNLDSNEALLWVLFKHFDIDGSNSITRENIAEALLKSGRLVEEEDIELIFSEHDVNQTGSIGFEEFKDMLSHLQVSPTCASD